MTSSTSACDNSGSDKIVARRKAHDAAQPLFGFGHEERIACGVNGSDRDLGQQRGEIIVKDERAGCRPDFSLRQRGHCPDTDNNSGS